ncbi:MAG: preprotein translocase subunit SecY [Eubacteriales bacterium]|nr:preprotein translocase subunit SecY [Eubacteriales bacterium]
MFQTIKNAWNVPELRKKILFTLLILLLYRLGANIPVPYVSADVLNSFNQYTAGSIFQFMNILSGDAFGKATLFALSVSPYITASIVIQLLTVAIPALERMAKDEDGKKKIAGITRIVTVALALITAYGYAMYLRSYNMLAFDSSDSAKVFKYAVIIACFCAGASLIMWLAEKINEFGIGNGISIILFANIIARLPALCNSLFGMMFDDGKFKWTGLILVIVSLSITLAAVLLVVWFTNSERRIPVQYAKRVVGRKMYGGQSSNLPLKLNMTGVMPIIFANSIVAIPATIATFFPNTKWLQWITNNFNYYTWPYLLVFLALIIAFSYFYTLISFNPVEVANNIRDNGGAIPGIRPGKTTAQYIQKILSRITLIGGVFLCVIAGAPMVITIVDYAIHDGSLTFAGLAFGGSSLLIVVGVALETVHELEAQLTMRNYKGFLD